MRRVKIENRVGSPDFRFTVEIDGTESVPKTSRLTNEEKDAAKIGISVEELKHVWGIWSRNRKAEPTCIELWVEIPEQQAATPQEFWVRVRGERQTTGEGVEYSHAEPLEAFRLSLGHSRDATDPLIEWKGTERLAALDVDFHDTSFDTRPIHADLVSHLPRILPQPPLAWLTHGRGVRGIYAASGEWRADELAAAAVFSVSERWPEASFEIKAITRHPQYARSNGLTCGPILRGVGPSDMTPLGNALAVEDSLDEDTSAAWLAERNYEIGKRYPHDRCPFSPSGKGGRDPVVIYRDGVFCHYCKGAGTRSYASFAALSRGLVASPVAACARKWSHWEHAQHVVEQSLGLRGTVARLAYRVALKIVHEVPDDDCRLAAAFDADNQLLRFDGFWCNRNGEPLVKKISPMLAALPACQTPEGKPIASRVSLFDQSASLDDEGYPAIQPIWGARIATVHQMPADLHRPHVVFYPADLRSRNKDRRPRYVPADERGDVEEAWASLGSPFPGIPRRYVELLIAAKGCAEITKAMPPVVFVSGPSGAAKTACIRVAAAICGDQCTDVVWSPIMERLRQAAMDAASQGTYCALNEATKLGRADGKGPLEVMDAILNFTERSSSHKLYVGAVPFGRLPVFVFTDTILPDEVQSDKQLARRLVWVPLHSQVFWERPMLDHGIDRPERIRISGKDFARACDVILSDVIDRYFRSSIPFAEIASMLGYGTAQESRAASSKAELRSFFDAVAASPARSLPPHGAGWVVIEPHVETELKRRWSELLDHQSGHSSRRCEAEDWGRLLGVGEPVKFEAVKHGSGVRIRFSRGRVFNADVLTDPVQLEPRPIENGVDRPGDAISCGSEIRFAGIPAASFYPAVMPRGEDAA